MKTLLHYLFLLCFNILLPAVHSQCIKDQQQSLLHFKNSLQFRSPFFADDPYPNKVISWNSSTDCCSWVGVTCTSNGHVVGLDLSSETISGGIDNASSLFHLQHLQSLNLAGNDFDSGTRIPSAIGKLVNLRYLNLSNNGRYSGQIPIEISRLTRLVILDISQRSSTMEAPNISILFQNLTELAELYFDQVDLSAVGADWSQAISSSLPNLRVLSLSYCHLSGPIDQSLAKLQSLSIIGLGGNDISCPIPGFFANFSNLRVLDLSWNRISGTVPGFFANFSKLTSLSLSGCWLNGTFPKEIFQIPTLETIDLGVNFELGGSLPEFPKNNGSLRSLSLILTNFSGSLPESIGNLKMLSTIELTKCNFHGSIPKSLANLTQLVSLHMSSNMFNGPIDSIHWENLINLVDLRLKDNLFKGSIPSSLFSLPFLSTYSSLVLSNNQFSGTLAFSNVSSYLHFLDLSFNNLEGPVPTSIFNFQRLTVLYLSSNNFSGFLFSGPQHLIFSNASYSPFPALGYLDLSSNNFSVLFSGPQQLIFSNASYFPFPALTYLDLSSNNLRTFPDFFLRNQSTLKYVDLSENHIRGKIPHWIWSSNQLDYLNLSCNSFVTLEAPLLNSTVATVDLHSNQLQEQIPTFLPYATYLDYSGNFFSCISSDIGDFLIRAQFFSLSSNNLDGLIPVSLCNASNLQILDMSNNSLSGMIPQCLTAMRHLSVLNLARNNLTGSISKVEVTDYCSLKILEFGGNQLGGQFPKSLAKCTMLEVLNLGNNNITDSFPCLLKNIFTLRVLVLRSNNFYGGTECLNTNVTWPQLQIIDLAHNNFHGEIQRILWRTWREMMVTEDGILSTIKVHKSEHKLEVEQNRGRGYSFEYGVTVTVTSKGFDMDLEKILSIYTLIDFSSNNFSGPIPKEMGEFKSLLVLNLSRNALTGEIPSLFSNMSVLESQDLSRNKLSGYIPPKLAELTFLSSLDLSYNQLVGKIPTSNQFSTFPPSSFIGNKGLWGFPLTVDNKAGFPPPPTVNGRAPNSGHNHEVNWDLIIVEIGFTFGFGVAVGSLVLCKRWSKWYYRVMYNIILKIFPQLEERIGIHRRHVHINQRWWRL